MRIELNTHNTHEIRIGQFADELHHEREVYAVKQWAGSQSECIERMC